MGKQKEVIGKRRNHKLTKMIGGRPDDVKDRLLRKPVDEEALGFFLSVFGFFFGFVKEFLFFCEGFVSF